MAASTSPHLAFNGLSSRLRAVEPKYDPSKAVEPKYDPTKDAYQSLREMVRTEENRRSWLSHLARSGVLFVILFEIGAVLGLRNLLSARAATLFPFEIFNIAAGAACLYITWTVWFHYNWRLVMFGFSGLIIAGASYLSLSSGQTEPLFISVILLLVAGGSLIPWNARWQGALTFLCLSWFGINAVCSATPLDTGLYEWLGLVAAAALAYSGVQQGGHYRSELSKQVELLCASHSRLRAELVHYIGLAERAGMRIDYQSADKLIMDTENRSRPFSVTCKKNPSLRSKLRHSINGDVPQMDQVNTG
jgi:hypothetical protein